MVVSMQSLITTMHEQARARPEAVGEVLDELSREVHTHPELAFEEHHAVRVVATVLADAGFGTAVGCYGLPTAVPKPASARTVATTRTAWCSSNASSGWVCTSRESSSRTSPTASGRARACSCIVVIRLCIDTTISPLRARCHQWIRSQQDPVAHRWTALSASGRARACSCIVVIRLCIDTTISPLRARCHQWIRSQQDPVAHRWTA